MVQPGDPAYLAECAPDAAYPGFPDVDFDELAALGINHVLLDVDGTLSPRGALDITVDEATAAKLAELEERNHQGMFETVSLATDNGRHPSNLLRSLGLTDDHVVFQPREAGRLGTQFKTSSTFWRRILFELDCWDTPETVGIIGDSPLADVVTPQQHGLRAVLVGGLEERRWLERVR
jgi:predicted HAD superfamily phosphohydrolase YqeG